MNISAPVAVICPVCQGGTDLAFTGLYDDRYGYPDRFDLRRCVSCGHMHIPAKFRTEELGELYTRYYPRGGFEIESFAPEQEKTGFSAWLSGERASAFRRVPKNVRVLDIGCGIGATLAYHRNRGCDAYGIEADENVQAIARRHRLSIQQGIFDGTQFDSDYFDYVTLDQVAEHVMDPHALMRGVARVLKHGGKVVITTPNPNSFGARFYGRRWLNWHVPYHLQFYTRCSLAMVAEKAGLKVLRAETVTPSEWQRYQWEHVLTFPSLGEKSSFWMGAPPRATRHVLLDRLIRLARRWSMHRWASRLLDALGRGDNFVFVLEKP